MNLLKLYDDLYQKYGPQGWWPLLETGYRKLDFSYPKNQTQSFEIALGAILTQNTAWQNVEKTLNNLKNQELLLPEKILTAPDEVLQNAIKSSGYYNQKLKKIKIFTAFFLSLKNRTPARNELLNLWGIGPETADSILLYAYKMPSFVIDAYTKRWLTSLYGADKIPQNYHDLKNIFEANLPADYELFQEYHALIVANGKFLCIANFLKQKVKIFPTL